MTDVPAEADTVLAKPAPRPPSGRPGIGRRERAAWGFVAPALIATTTGVWGRGQRDTTKPRPIPPRTSTAMPSTARTIRNA